MIEKIPYEQKFFFITADPYLALTHVFRIETAQASESDGTILDGTTRTKICKNTDCSSFWQYQLKNRS